MDSTQVCFYNALLYSFILIYWRFKYGFSMGEVIWLMFTASAWCTYFFIQQPLYIISIHYSNQTVFPFIYLFITLYLLISPFCKLKPLPKGSIRFSHDLFIKRYMIFMIIVQCISIIVNIPAVLDALSVSQQNITDYKDFSYEENINIPAFKIPILAQIKGWILLGLRISNYALMFILSLCYNKYRKIAYCFCIVTVLESFFNTIIIVSRGQMFMLSMFCIFMFILLYHYTTIQMRKYVMMGGCIIGFVLVSFVITISLGRFGTDGLGFYLYKYFGEPMNNFNGLLFNDIQGTTNGSAYLLSYINDIVGISNFQTTMEKWSYIEKITGVSGQFFYTFIGGLVMEFGKIITLLVVLLLHFFFRKLIKEQLSFNLGELLVLALIFYYFIAGVFLFPVQGKAGFLEICSTIILYKYFSDKNRKIAMKHSVMQ